MSTLLWGRLLTCRRKSYKRIGRLLIGQLSRLERIAAVANRRAGSHPAPHQACISNSMSRTPSAGSTQFAMGGNANATYAPGILTCVAGVSPTCAAAQKTMNCRPFIAYTEGIPSSAASTSVSHRIFPDSTSSARTFLSRVPVKINISGNSAEKRMLKPGMNVKAIVSLDR